MIPNPRNNSDVRVYVSPSERVIGAGYPEPDCVGSILKVEQIFRKIYARLLLGDKLLATIDYIKPYSTSYDRDSIPA